MVPYETYDRYDDMLEEVRTGLNLESLEQTEPMPELMM